MTIEWLDPLDPEAPFPPLEQALTEPNGLLAAGGDLSPARLLHAYRQGIFPWYEEDQPILWWSPDPRAVLYPEDVHISRSLRKTLRKSLWTITFDRAFGDTVTACAAPRRGAHGTWITREMHHAYTQLHAQGYAHSIELWDVDGQLVGGLYGVAVGRAFFGESMFSWRTDASKVAMVVLMRHLYAWGYALMDCQLPSAHLVRMGARLIPRHRFIEIIGQAGRRPSQPAPWRVQPELNWIQWQPPG